jgi:pyruvate dehydrogenase (quinone)
MPLGVGDVNVSVAGSSMCKQISLNDPTLAQQLIDVLRQAGVERGYGVVGDSLNPVVDVIRRTDGIEWVHVRDEEAGAFAAAGRGAADRPAGRVRGQLRPGQHAPGAGDVRRAPRRRAGARACLAHPVGADRHRLFQEPHPARLFGECSISASW